mmetsp:Transcript_9293/g.28128  ORF Transcript_9293/g.28128 Transcript_9293/m.28128 type:complete len:360 (-) Transcript_9293:600-1679(-)
MLLPARTLGSTAAAACTLLLLAHDADFRGTHTAAAAAVLEWAAPTLALLSASALVRHLPLPALGAPDTERVYPEYDKPLPLSRAVLRDSESLALGVPACIVANGIALSSIQMAAGEALTSLQDHSHLLCWAVDWLGALPIMLISRAALGSNGYRFNDPADWRSAHLWSTTGKVIFSQPSSVSPNCEVEVREHLDGWRTLRFILPGGQGSVQSIHRLKGAGTCDEQAIANEYLKTTAAATLAALGACRQEGGLEMEQPLRLLFLGLGGGTLASLFAHLCPDSQMIAVELDQVRQVITTLPCPSSIEGCTLWCRLSSMLQHRVWVYVDEMELRSCVATRTNGCVTQQRRTLRCRALDLTSL